MSEFTTKEIADARKAIEGEKESSVLISRRARLAQAAGFGDVSGSTGNDASDSPVTGTTGTAARSTGRGSR